MIECDKSHITESVGGVTNIWKKTEEKKEKRSKEMERKQFDEMCWKKGYCTLPLSFTHSHASGSKLFLSFNVQYLAQITTTCGMWLGIKSSAHCLK